MTASEKWRRFVPITKVDEERRTVFGALAVEEPDKSGEIFDYAGSVPYFKNWSESFVEATDGKSRGNLRAMHGKVAAGKFTAVEFDDDTLSIPVAAKVVDDNEWRKCLEGVYTGFSIGGSYVKRWTDEASGLVRYIADPIEGSLVDNPCIAGSTFELLRSHGQTVMRKFRTSGDATRDEELEAAYYNGVNVGLDVGEERGLEKSAQAAVIAGEAAIEALKTMAAEYALCEGEPDTWSLSDIVSAMGDVLCAKYSAEQRAEQEGATATPTPTEPTTPTVPTEGDGEPAEMAARVRVEVRHPAGGLLKAYDDAREVNLDALRKQAEPFGLQVLVKTAVGDKVAELRGEKEMTVEALAEAAGDDVDVEMVEGIESGDITEPTEVAITAIAGALEAEADDLLALMKEKEEEPEGDAEGEGEGEGDAGKVLVIHNATITKASKGSLGEEDLRVVRETVKEVISEALKVIEGTSLSKDDLDKSLSAVGKGLTERLDGLDSRLAKVEETPAEVGRPARPVHKELGGDGTTINTLAPEVMQAAVEKLESAGQLSGGARTEVRKALAAASVPRV